MVIMVFNRMEVYSWIINCLIRTIKMIKYEDNLIIPTTTRMQLITIMIIFVFSSLFILSNKLNAVCYIFQLNSNHQNI